MGRRLLQPTDLKMCLVTRIPAPGTRDSCCPVPAPACSALRPPQARTIHEAQREAFRARTTVHPSTTPELVQTLHKTAKPSILVGAPHPALQLRRPQRVLSCPRRPQRQSRPRSWSRSRREPRLAPQGRRLKGRPRQPPFPPTASQKCCLLPCCLPRPTMPLTGRCRAAAGRR